MGKDHIIQLLIEAKDLATSTIHKTVQSLDNFQQKVEGLSGRIKGLSGDLGGFSSAIAGVGAALSAGALARSFVDINASVEKTKIMLTELMGSTRKADEAFQWLTAQTTKMPFSIDAVKESFIKLKVAGIDPMGGSMQTLADAIAAFGGTDQDLKLASLAIQQMASKGVVSMEELRQQLGERIPTAMKAMAAGLGYSTDNLQAFFKAVESGSISAQTGLAAMFKELEKAHKGMSAKMMDSWGGMMSTLKSAWQQTMIALGEAGAFTKIKDAVQGVIDKINELKASGQLQIWVNQVLAAMSSLIDAFKGLAGIVSHLFMIFGSSLPVIAEWLVYLGALKTALNLAATAAALLGNKLTLVFGAFAIGWQVGKWISDLEFFGMKIGEWVQVVIANYHALFLYLQIGWQTVKKYMMEVITIGFADTSGIDKHIAALRQELVVVRDVRLSLYAKRQEQEELNKSGEKLASTITNIKENIAGYKTNIEGATGALKEHKGAVDNTTQAINKLNSIELKIGLDREELKTLSVLLTEYINRIKEAYELDKITYKDYIERKKQALESYYRSAISLQNDLIQAAGEDAAKKAAAEGELYRIMSQYRKDMIALEDEYFKYLSEKEKARLDDAELSAEQRKKIEKDLRETVQKELGQIEASYTKLYKTIDTEGNEVWSNVIVGSKKTTRELAKTFEDFVANAKEQTDILDESINKQRKIDINNSEAINAVERVREALASIPDVTTKKLVIETEYSGSPRMSFTEGIRYMKDKIKSLPTGSSFVMQFKEGGSGDDFSFAMEEKSLKIERLRFKLQQLKRLLAELRRGARATIINADAIAKTLFDIKETELAIKKLQVGTGAAITTTIKNVANASVEGTKKIKQVASEAKEVIGELGRLTDEKMKAKKFLADLTGDIITALMLDKSELLWELKEYYKKGLITAEEYKKGVDKIQQDIADKLSEYLAEGKITQAEYDKAKIAMQQDLQAEIEKMQARSLDEQMKMLKKGLTDYQDMVLGMPKTFHDAVQIIANKTKMVVASMQNDMMSAMNNIKRAVPDLLGGETLQTLQSDVAIQKDLSIHNTFQVNTFDELTTRRWLRDTVFPEWERMMQLKGVRL